MNLIIYIGLTAYFFSFDEETRKYSYFPTSVGVIEIIMIVLSALGVAFGVHIKIRNKNKVVI